MRKHFPGYYPPTEEEFKELWNTAYFSFDANVLLDLFRVTPQTHDRLFDILERLKDRLWLPHQAAAEFQKNRLGVILAQEALYDKLKKCIHDSMDESHKKIVEEVQSLRRPLVDPTKLTAIIKETRESLDHAIQEMQVRQRDTAEADRVFDRLTRLFDDKVGAPYPPDEWTKKLAEAKKRYDQGIPPGYEDKKVKPEPGCYGDAVLWFQLLDFARSHDRPVILVGPNVAKGEISAK